MAQNQWWARTAKPEEQGSFCDTESGYHYNNVSKEEAIEEEESAMRRGDDVVGAEYELTDYSDRVRFNTNLTEVDAQRFEHPTRHRPGK